MQCGFQPSMEDQKPEAMCYRPGSASSTGGHKFFYLWKERIMNGARELYTRETWDPSPLTGVHAISDGYLS